MEALIYQLGAYWAILVPLIAVCAIGCLYALEAGHRCPVTESMFFLALMLIAGCTLRTVIVNEGCWLVHTASLGCMIVAGVMRRPVNFDGHYSFVEPDEGLLER